MNARTLASSRLAVVGTILGSLIRISPAHAGGGFLWLPFSAGTRTPEDCRRDCSTTGVCIYCTWSSCVDGTAYNHQAMDYGCTRYDTEVRAASDGEVIHARSNIPRNTFPLGGAYGNIVKIRHSTGHETWYAHLLPGIRVAEGNHVTAGQLLGLSDNTGRSSGPHLHFEVRDAQGRRVNPYGDPADYTGGCGTNALWVTCPPTPAPPPDADGDGYTVAAGDCNDVNRDVHPGADESCNERDDDCNGTADDPWRIGLAQDLGNPCTVSTGICANTGTWTCAPNGVTTVCSVDALPSQPESCNGLDDDCDGDIDEDWRSGLAQDISNPCTIEWDTCRGSTSGTWVCAPGGLSTVCDAPTPGGTPASAETCNDADDDCNGVVDDLASVVVGERLEEVRDHVSLAWNPDREQFIAVWAERGAYPEAYGFAIRSRMLDVSGNPIGETRTITSGDRTYSHGTDVTWNGSEYGVAWLASAPVGVGWMYELVFVPLDVDGASMQAANVVAGPWPYAGMATSLTNRVNIVTRDTGFTIGAYTAHVLDPNAGDVLLFRLTPTGEVIGTPISVIENYEDTAVIYERHALTIVDGQEVVVWIQHRHPSDAYPAIMFGTWSGATMRRMEVEPRTDNQSFGFGVACASLRSCHVLSIGAMGGGLSELYDIDAVDLTFLGLRRPSIPSELRGTPSEGIDCVGTSCVIASFTDSPLLHVALSSFQATDGATIVHRVMDASIYPRTFAIQHSRSSGMYVWDTSWDTPNSELHAMSWCNAVDE